MQQFYEGLAEVLEIEPSDISPDLVLADHSWDSLAVVSTIALIDEVFGIIVPGQALLACKTAGEIEALVRATKG